MVIIAFYKQIIQHPFLGKYLKPSDFFSRAGTSQSAFNIDYDLEMNGEIYTQKNAPEFIKYLKVINPNDANSYLLMGNGQGNIFECSWWLDKDCEMKGGGGNDEFNQNLINIDGFLKLPSTGSPTEAPLQYLEMYKGDTQILLGSEINNQFFCPLNTCIFYGWKGDDEYIFGDQSNGSVIKDFNNENDKDKIILEKGVDIRVIPGGSSKSTLEIEYNRNFRYIDLEGKSHKEVEGWIDVLEASYEYIDPITNIKYAGSALDKLKEGNPILIR